jgi:hypothetical protein
MDMASKHPLPGFLKGRCTPAHYYKWLHQKADLLPENIFRGSLRNHAG